MLKIYDSYTKTIKLFQPLNNNTVNIYVCGMTVYDYCHIGHARTMIAFDVIIRYLKHLNYNVNYVRNITDIDDKIIKRAQQENCSITTITDKYIKAMHEDFAALGLLTPNQEPRATLHIDGIIKLISDLIKKNHAYVGAGADVYYSVRAFLDYGKLANRNLADLISGARVEINKDKKDPLDFVLWKNSAADEPGWNSPWGYGRPGWHSECAAMVLNCFGTDPITIDIHGGGCDLLFPHHENEIAQAECISKKKVANFWLHTGHLNINKEKMSKSLNNFFTIRDMLKKYSAETIRFFMLSGHYKSPLDYSEEAFTNAKAALTRLYTALNNVLLNNMHDFETQNLAQNYIATFNNAMNDDFNTANAIAVLFDLARELNSAKVKNKKEAQCLAATLKYLGGILNILQNDPEKFLQNRINENNLDLVLIENLMQERMRARQNKNFSRADDIRDKLDKMGIIIEDAAGKTTWRIK